MATGLAASELLAGRYELDRELGRGATGRVLLAHDRHAEGAPRAIKLVSAEQAARLRWEFGLLARLAHPNLLQVYELLRVERPPAGFDLGEGSAALVTELAEGQSAALVAQELQRDPDARVALALVVADGVARALAALHGAGLVHGDVKPENIVVSPERTRCKLVDFGLAGEVALPARPAGTPGYMAPELYRGERGPASDLYALGATLARLLHGSAGRDETSKSPREHLAQALLPVKERPPLPGFVPSALARLIEALLEPEAESRLARAAEVAARVALIAHERGVSLTAETGSGADDAPSAQERALAVASLPLCGQAAALDALAAALADGRSCAVCGPRGAGRSRVVREAVRRLQSARLAAGGRVPTYRTGHRLPQQPLEVDTVLHLRDADDVSLAEAQALLDAARIEGQGLVLVLECSEPPATTALDGAALPVIAIAALAEGEVRRLLEQALPGLRISGALVRDALAASSGLAGRLCTLLAGGLASGVDVSRGASLRALASDGAGAVDALPQAGRELAELLCIAGGELEAQAAETALGSAAALAEGHRALLAAGLASQSGARLVLRDDCANALRGALAASGALQARAARLPARELDGRAQAQLWLVRGEAARAVAAFCDEAARLLAAGSPERAEQCAREALASALPEGATDRLRLLLAESLRAQGRYIDARHTLEGAAGPRARLMAAELARLLGERELARTLTAELESLAAEEVASEVEALGARLDFDEGEFGRAEQRAEAAALRARGEAAALRAKEVVALAQLARGLRTQASETVKLALERARRAGLRAAEARLTSVFAELAREQGEPREAARRFAAAFELADAAGEYHAAASFLHNVGIQRLDCGEPGPAIAALREAARRLSRLGRSADSARALYNLAHAAELIGAQDVALASALRARKAASAAGDAITAAHAACLEAELRLEAGERASVGALLQLPELQARALPPAASAVIAARCASLHRGLGELDAARDELVRAEALAGDSEAAQIECALARAELALETGDDEAARAAALAAQALCQRAADFGARLRALGVSARAARRIGDPALAALRLSELRSLLDEAGRGLSSAERARLRAVDAYRAAFEALPSVNSTERGTASGANDERWRALAGTAKRLAGERRLPRLYELVLECAIELASAERGYLVMKDGDGQPRVRAARGLSAAAEAGQERGLSHSIVARVLGSGRALSTMDAATDERLSGAASVHALSLRSVLAVPLAVRGEVAGALYLEDRLRPFAFSELELSLLSDLAELASIALDSAQLLRAERRAGRRLSAMRRKLARTVEVQALEIDALRSEKRAGGASFPGIVAHSPSMQRVLATLGKIARSEVPVLIRGESGTGKELIARAIHANSPQHGAPFVSENCGAIPEPLLESALFGHVRGAFTGADKRRLGLFEVADGGTLFLDEIGEMPPSMQAKLLRVLQDGEVRPLGSAEAHKVRVRVLCATHRDLDAMVADGRFREDLYYRLAVVTVALPPLRERVEDIAPLISHFIAQHAAGRKVELDRRALAALTSHPWPGNVRQLENEIRRALVLADSAIATEHLSPGLLHHAATVAADPFDMRAQVDQLERKLIQKALEAAAGNQTRAARMLGVSRFGLQKMMRRLQA